MDDPRALKIYIDGSALHNPGKQVGFGMIILFPDFLNRPREELRLGYFEGTNNRMELRACLSAFKYVIENAEELGITRTIIITDSEYVFFGKNKCDYWRKNKWIKSNGEEVENIDLWKDFLRLRGRLPIKCDFRLIKGKTCKMSKLVDQLAKEGAKSPTKRDYKYRPGRVSVVKLGGVAQRYPFNKKIKIKVYRHSIKGLTTNRYFKIYFLELKRSKFVGKYYAYCDSNLQRQHQYEITLNNFSGIPLIKKYRDVTVVK